MKSQEMAICTEPSLTEHLRSCKLPNMSQKPYIAKN